MDEPRTEQASPRKLARARSRGLVARSPDLCAAAAVLACACALLAGGERLLAALRALLLAGLNAAPAAGAHPLTPLAGALRELAFALAPPLLAAAFGAALAGFVQVGPLFAGAAIAPDLRRLTPGDRLRASFSVERWAELGFSALKLGTLLGIATLVLAQSARGVFALPLGSVARAAEALAALLSDFGLRMGAALLG